MPTDGRKQYPDEDGTFDNAPYFNFNNGKLKLDTNHVSNVNDNYGSVSFVLPKSFLKWDYHAIAG